MHVGRPIFTIQDLSPSRRIVAPSAVALNVESWKLDVERRFRVLLPLAGTSQESWS